jgi:hypothetical protein
MGSPLTGSPVTSGGAVTLVGSGCIPFNMGNTLFGLRLMGTMDTIPLPEPSSGLLLASGLVGLVLARRARR